MFWWILKKVNNPVTGLEFPRGFQEVKDCKHEGEF
jgi:hypothetical protein